ncbi:MAG: ABC transporter ATP-binding protein, partial [Pseudomonadota bacterium]
MSIRVSGLSKAYGSHSVLDGLDLEVERQSFTVMCGPTGSGKSVLLRLLVGLETPDAGTISLNGVDITGYSAAQRTVGYVPQSFALYPHLTVRANIGYPLKLAGRPSPEIAKRVDWAAGVLDINHLLAKTPDLLSGGEKQRTAVAR